MSKFAVYFIILSNKKQPIRIVYYLGYFFEKERRGWAARNAQGAGAAHPSSKWNAMTLLRHLLPPSEQLLSTATEASGQPCGRPQEGNAQSLLIVPPLMRISVLYGEDGLHAADVLALAREEQQGSTCAGSQGPGRSPGRLPPGCLNVDCGTCFSLLVSGSTRLLQTSHCIRELSRLAIAVLRVHISAGAEDEVCCYASKDDTQRDGTDQIEKAEFLLLKEL